jgi:hypothetical protein
MPSSQTLHIPLTRADLAGLLLHEPCLRLLLHPQLYTPSQVHSGGEFLLNKCVIINSAAEGCSGTFLGLSGVMTVNGDLPPKKRREQGTIEKIGSDSLPWLAGCQFGRRHHPD